MSRDIHTSHTVSVLIYHAVCPATYRRAVFTTEVDAVLLEVCLEIAKRYEIVHVVVTVPPPAVEPTEVVVGVDLGLAQPAVTSQRQFLGQRRWKAIEGRYFHVRRALQKKGSKNAKRRLRRMRQKQARFRRDCDHVLSKQIVHAIPEGSTIVVENDQIGTLWSNATGAGWLRPASSASRSDPRPAQPAQGCGAQGHTRRRHPPSDRVPAQSRPARACCRPD